MSDVLTNDELQRFRLMKEDAAERAPERGTDDMTGFLEVYRDGKPLLAIFCSQVDRDQLLDAAFFVVPAVGADRVLAVMDAHLSKQMENPATGKPWGPGEMQKACHEDGMCSTGAITDCLIINDVRRDGTYHMHSLTYHIDEAAKEAGDQPVAVHWVDEGDELHRLNTDGKLEGLVPDALRAAFEQESPSQDELEEMADAMGLPALHAKAARDAATIARLAIQGYGVAVTGNDKEYFRIVKDLLDHLPQMGGESLTAQEIGDESIYDDD